ncbi:MAG: hypothetical protein U0232_15785 [Thermomicrobiales bacterium]
MRGETRSDALTAAVGGLALIVTSVWTATRALGPGLQVLDLALWPLAKLRLIVRPAAGYLSAGRLRTGLTVTMFGMVVFIMVASLTMIETLVNAYAGREAPVAGFDLRADLPGSVVAERLPDLAAALDEQQAIRRAAFGAIGGTALIDARVIQLGIPRSAGRTRRSSRRTTVSWAEVRWASSGARPAMATRRSGRRCAKARVA